LREETWCRLLPGRPVLGNNRQTSDGFGSGAVMGLRNFSSSFTKVPLGRLGNQNIRSACAPRRLRPIITTDLTDLEVSNLPPKDSLSVDLTNSIRATKDNCVLAQLLILELGLNKAE
jgi:hypothetical protein